MRSLLTCLALVIGVSTGARAQNQGLRFDLVHSLGGTIVTMEVSGPANGFFDVFYTALPLSNAITLQDFHFFMSGRLDPTGRLRVQAPLIPGLVLENMWFGVVLHPTVTGLSPQAAGPVALALRGPAGGPAGCNSDGELSFDASNCLISLSGKVCPGDVISIKINGVEIIAGTAGSTGQIALGITRCLGAGDELTATKNGVAWLGPVRR